MFHFKNFFCSVVSLVSLSSITGIESLAKVPYIGLIKEVHRHYPEVYCPGEDKPKLLDLVNDYVFYSNKGNNKKSREKKLQVEKEYADAPYFLPWNNVNDEKYQFLFKLDYSEDLDGFDGEYTKKTNKISKEFISLVHAYEWYSAGIKKYREKLRSAPSTNLSNEDVEYIKKSIIIMNQERMMIADDLVGKIKNNWYRRHNVDLDFYTKSSEWNEKAREVTDIMEQMEEPGKSIKTKKVLLSIFADEDIKSELASFWNKRELENMLKQSSEKIEASRKEELSILKKFLKELKLLTPLAPKEEEEKSYLKKKRLRNYDFESATDEECSASESSLPDIRSHKSAAKVSALSAKSAPEDPEDPDDIEILHGI